MKKIISLWLFTFLIMAQFIDLSSGIITESPPTIPPEMVSYSSTPLISMHITPQITPSFKPMFIDLNDMKNYLKRSFPTINIPYYPTQVEYYLDRDGEDTYYIHMVLPDEFVNSLTNSESNIDSDVIQNAKDIMLIHQSAVYTDLYKNMEGMRICGAYHRVGDLSLNDGFYKWSNFENKNITGFHWLKN